MMCCYTAADAADDKCYETFNTAGRFNGHCGLNGTFGGYLQCAAEYVVYVFCLLVRCLRNNQDAVTVSGKLIYLITLAKSKFLADEKVVTKTPRLSRFTRFVFKACYHLLFSLFLDVAFVPKYCGHFSAQLRLCSVKSS